MILSAGFTFHLGIGNWINYGFFAFFSTLAVYNGQRIFKTEQLNKTPWLDWVKQNRRALIFVVITSSIAALACLISVLTFNWSTIPILAISGMISVLYVIKVRGVNMREIPYLKIHLIAISWTLVLIVFPIANESIDASALYYGFAHYLFVIGVTIPFDIRDLKHDSTKHKTIPQVGGVTNAKAIGTLSIFIFAVLIALTNRSFLLNPLFFIAVTSQIVLLSLTSERRSDIYCAGLVDGAIAILGFSYFIS